jgi:thiol-disulfide isomerase/thioredoxin
MMRTQLALITLLSMLGSQLALAVPEALSIAVGSQVEIPIERHAAQGEHLLLWLPSEHGVRTPQTPIAEDLAAGGVEVWIADLHSGYFVPTGRASIASFAADDIADLIERARAQSGKRVFVAATGRGALVALRAARLWQERHGENAALGGLVLFHPYLYQERPGIGEDADYAPIVHETNLPVFLLQPTLSAKYWRTGEAVEQLRAGGAEVFARVLPEVTDGFHLRTDSGLTPVDLAARARAPRYVAQAIRLLDGRPPVRAAAPEARQELSARRPAARADDAETTALRATAPRTAPPLHLPELKGRSIAQPGSGAVLLVSFWASWCPPCIEEMPSLERLQERFAGQPFRLISVNIGESPETIQTFLDKVEVDFPVLLDPEGETLGPWRVYAYPSNYLVDGSGNIRYGHYGAIDWDQAQIVALVADLVAEGKPSRSQENAGSHE